MNVSSAVVTFLCSNSVTSSSRILFIVYFTFCTMHSIRDYLPQHAVLRPMIIGYSCLKSVLALSYASGCCYRVECKEIFTGFVLVGGVTVAFYVS